MLRRLVLAALCLALPVGQQATAAPASTGLARGSVVQGAAECGGPGFVKVVVDGPTVPYYCVHAAADTFDALAAGRAVAAGKPAVGVAPRCYGDGQTGPRLQLVYGYAKGDPDRSRVAVPQIRSVAAKMEAIVRASSAGKDLGIRFAMTKGCGAVDVKVVAFPRTALYNSKPGDPSTQFAAIGAELDRLGLNRADRKYNVLWDGWAKDGTCGLGSLLPLTDAPHPVNPNNGLPTVGGYTDAGSTVTNAAGLEAPPVPRLSVSWNHVFGKKGPTCWGTGRFEWPIAPLHEMQHNIGAVQTSSPNSDGAGHCLDVPSVMCYGAKVVYVPQCDNKPVPVFDCGQDDYWNPSPAPGSYLDTRANLARSQFYGPQPQDALVGSPL